MSGSLHLLVYYGGQDLGPCDYFRLGAYVPLLAELGIEVRAWTDFNDYVLRVPPDYADRPEEAARAGLATIDRTPIDWADVILFRRWHPTRPACEPCDLVFVTRAEAAAHGAQTGHPIRDPDAFVEGLVTTFERNPEVLRGRAIVYETDDDLLRIQPWTAMGRQLRAERPLIERMLRRADLVTVTTPVLARSMGRYNDAVRVIRNAIDPRLYELPETPADLPGDPRILYYGGATRLRDYAVVSDAVEAAGRAFPEARRIWIGGAHEPRIVALVDEALPYVEGVPEFVHSLLAARPDIGLAPVVGDDFDRARSELHWLDYSMAGAATLASRTMGGGPYDVIRDGVDGLLARNKQEWREKLLLLAGSRLLREELAGRARERVLADYDIRTRVHDWADAYRWAAERGGRGSVGRLHPGVGPVTLAVARETAAATARANLVHRQLERAEIDAARATLGHMRAGRDVCWPEEDAIDPLVTVRIPTHDRGPLIVERAISSALAQTYDNLEILVVGDGATPETVEAVRSVSDPRIRFVNLPQRGVYPDEPERRWMVAGWPAVNHALDIARGAWVAPLDDDDEFTPDHVEILLRAAIEQRLEFVYGRTLMEFAEGQWGILGAWPPAHGAFTHGSVLYSARLRFLRYDPESWREEEPADWNLWRRMLEAGVRMGIVDAIVYRHYREARHRTVGRIPVAGTRPAA